MPRCERICMLRVSHCAHFIFNILSSSLHCLLSTRLRQQRHAFCWRATPGDWQTKGSHSHSNVHSSSHSQTDLHSSPVFLSFTLNWKLCPALWASLRGVAVPLAASGTAKKYRESQILLASRQKVWISFREEYPVNM